MKILYAVQATGNGHISRACEILPVLKNRAQVHVLLSGNNSSLEPGFEVNYRSKGYSLHYNLLLYTSDAADELNRLHLVGRSIIKKKKYNKLKRVHIYNDTSNYQRCQLTSTR